MTEGAPDYTKMTPPQALDGSGALIPVLLDSSGNIISVLQGVDSGSVLRTLEAIGRLRDACEGAAVDETNPNHAYLRGYADAARALYAVLVAGLDAEISEKI